jgi:hypothetical protein
MNLADKSLANIHETQVAQFCLEADYVESTSEVSLWGLAMFVVGAQLSTAAIGVIG